MGDEDTYEQFPISDEPYTFEELYGVESMCQHVEHINERHLLYVLRKLKEEHLTITSVAKRAHIHHGRFSAWLNGHIGNVTTKWLGKIYLAIRELSDEKPLTSRGKRV